MKKMSYHRLAGVLLATLGSAAARAESNDLTDMSIDQLMNMEVTTASKKEQKLTETASAVYVLSNDDIKRSGATTLPELLLMVPGVDGGAINSHASAIGIRGLGGQWSNKLLVLIDGQSIYTRTFSGVYWESYNIPFEDIERIEVIRGPNAALWGANAVNGVINIITKSSSATQGTLLRATAGTRDNGDALAQQGFKLGENGFGRIYANSEKHGDSGLYGGGNGGDHWDGQRAGFRTDWDLRSGDRLMLQGDAYHMDTHVTPLYASQLPVGGVVPISVAVNSSATSHGHSLAANWTHTYALASEWSAQIYWSHSDRDEFIPLVEDNVDFDFQHRFQPAEHHDLVWGVSTRYRKDDSTPTPYIQFDPENASDKHSSLFFQDDIALAAGKYHVIVGSRFEHDEYNGWVVQPNLRGLWNVSEKQKLWAAVSRAGRTPSRVDRDVDSRIPVSIPLPPNSDLNPGPTPVIVPAILNIHGNKDFKTETLLTYELGYRVQPTASTSIDIALFHNSYDHLRSVGFGGYTPTPTGVLVDLPMTNTLDGRTWGGELVLNWAPRNDWRLQVFWSELRMDLHDTNPAMSSNYEGSSPERQMGLRADWDFAPRWSVDLQMKYVGELSDPFNSALIEGGKIPSYVDADLRIAWQVMPTLELALLGKNLFDSSRLEFSTESGAALTETKQAAYLRAVWSF